MNRGLHLMTAETLKRDAGAIIKLREYIIANDIKEDNLEDPAVLTAMLPMVTTFNKSKFVYKNIIDSFKDLLPILPKNEHQPHPTDTVTYYINTHNRLIHSN
ncbi:hypothetical protein TKK_0006572 [Trichogramma kaykai]|uniref:Uncharacterized protein n=1 Tax=Trichogramma kaykai TaxID=54128 RepID=A0ABD2XC01_9HYME